jgi:hypothetical protein
MGTTSQRPLLPVISYKHEIGTRFKMIDKLTYRILKSNDQSLK